MGKIVLAFLFCSIQSWAQYPEHYRYMISVQDPTTSTVNRDSFESIPYTIISLHTDLSEAQQIGSIFINVDWVKPYYSAWADFKDGVYSLNFWGGLARIPGMNDEGFALIACHELGHVLGQSPRIKISHFLWSSAEGQSDYFATGICLKRYFAFLNLLGKLKVPDIERKGYTSCRLQYDSEEDFLICLNTLSAIQSFAFLLKHLNPEFPLPSLETPSSKKVQETIYDSYPDNQCRVDTLYQGALCPKNIYPCGKGLGARPQCWFKSAN